MNVNLRPWEVKAFLAERKTQIRRPMKDQPVVSGPNWGYWWSEKLGGRVTEAQMPRLHSPFGVPGDVLIGREKLVKHDGIWYYKSDMVPVTGSPQDEAKAIVWVTCHKRRVCPVNQMPLWAARFRWIIKRSWVHRLNDIAHKDALEEGVEYDVSKQGGDPISRFKKLWKSDHGRNSFDSRWVWAAELEVSR